MSWVFLWHQTSSVYSFICLFIHSFSKHLQRARHFLALTQFLIPRVLIILPLTGGKLRLGKRKSFPQMPAPLWVQDRDRKEHRVQREKQHGDEAGEADWGLLVNPGWLTLWTWVEWTPGVGDGQGGIACCDSWGHKESYITEWLKWTELNIGVTKHH